MRRPYRLSIFLLYALAFVMIPIAATYYYQRLLGTDTSCDASQYDKNVLIASGLISTTLIIATLGIAKVARDKALFATSCLLLPASLALGFIILVMKAGCFF